MIYDLLETTMRLMSRQVFEASRNTRAQWLKDLLKLADCWKPQGYDDACRQLRDYYQGDQNQYLLTQMKRQFPTTYSRLPLVTMPVTARWVDQQATVYLKPAGRMLKQPDGSDVEDPQVQQVWGKLQDRAAYAEEWQALDRAVHLVSGRADAMALEQLAAAGRARHHPARSGLNHSRQRRPRRH